VLINFYGDPLWSHYNQMNLNALEYALSSILREHIREEKVVSTVLTSKLRFQDCAITVPLEYPLPAIPTGWKN
jgi:hypothetical protein